MLAGLVADGLAVGADGADFARIAAALMQQLRDAFGVQVGQRVGGQRLAVDFVVAGGLQVEECLPQRGRKGHVGVRQQHRTRAGEVDQHAVDTVQAGAGHQADVALADGGGKCRHAREHTSGGSGWGGFRVAVGRVAASR